MKVVFVSNYMNHHQLPLSKALLNIPDVEYQFIATVPISEERLKFGYCDMDHKYDFVIRTYDNEENYNQALKLCVEADVVIIGGADKNFIRDRLKQNKLTFKYSERMFKIKPAWYKMPFYFIKYFIEFGMQKNFYLLAASCYAAADYAKVYTFLGKAYKWGYFPEVKKYKSIDEVIDKKRPSSILWVGRLIDWKHPEAAIYVAKRLNEDGYDFTLNILGNGDMQSELEKMICSNGLSDCVQLLGSMSPEKVREYMESSQIYLFTSDRQEGWGAVLNEAMNSGCAVVASGAIGSVLFLINDGVNGCVYQDGNIDELYQKVKYLLDNPEKSRELGNNAYDTLLKEWNAQNAAQRFVSLVKEMLDGNKKPDIFNSGVCSKAEIIKD